MPSLVIEEAVPAWVGAVVRRAEFSGVCRPDLRKCPPPESIKGKIRQANKILNEGRPINRNGPGVDTVQGWRSIAMRISGEQLAVNRPTEVIAWLRMKVEKDDYFLAEKMCSICSR